MITRAGRLIGTAMDSAEISAEALGQAVGISSGAINEIRIGEAIMPLAQQLLLARFVISTSPKLRRQGHALEAQVLAATGFRAKQVASHAEPPGAWQSRRRK